MKNIVIATFAMGLASCASTPQKAFLKKSTQDDLIYRPVIDLRIEQKPSAGETQFVNFDEWLDGVLLSEISDNTQSSLKNCLINTSTLTFVSKISLTSQPRTDKITCFNKLSPKLRVKHRAELVDVAMAYSQNNCLRRGNLTSNIVNSSDTIVGTLLSLTSTAGIAVSDAASARAAAGTFGILNSFWSNSKSKLLNDANFSSFNSSLAVQRAKNALEILEETTVIPATTEKIEKSYASLGLMATVNKINEFDNTCDFFR